MDKLATPRAPGTRNSHTASSPFPDNGGLVMPEVDTEELLRLHNGAQSADLRHQVNAQKRRLSEQEVDLQHARAGQKGLIAREAFAQAELSELRLYCTELERRLSAATKALDDTQIELAQSRDLVCRIEVQRQEQVSRLQDEVRRLTEEVAGDRPTPTSRSTEKEKAHIKGLEKQLSVLGAQLAKQQNATATASGSAVELKGQLKELQTTAAQKVTAANARADAAGAFIYF